MWTLPSLRPPWIHVISVSRPSLYFAAIPIPCIVNANQRVKWGRPGNKVRRKNLKVDQRGVVLDVLLKPSAREKACYSIRVPVNEKEGDLGCQLSSYQVWSMFNNWACALHFTHFHHTQWQLLLLKVVTCMVLWQAMKSAMCCLLELDS